MLRDFSQMLKDAGLRVTQPRLDALAYFAAQDRPVSLQRLAEHLADANVTTVYRMVETFVAQGILRGCDVGHGHTDYELADLPHHHHVVCASCGYIEEVEDCVDEKALHMRARKRAKNFTHIAEHQTTFFGTCITCA